jgi:hypothetical protein
MRITFDIGEEYFFLAFTSYKFKHPAPKGYTGAPEMNVYVSRT